jgi:multiple sugar transport system substrate-binding protein
LLEPYPENLFPMRDMKTDFALFNQAFAFGNRFYFYPQGLMTSLMFYNKNLWAESGLASTPKTWDDFRLSAKKLTRMTAAGKFDRVGFDLSPWQAGLMWSDLRYQTGGFIYSEDGKRVEWDDSNGAKAANLLFDMTVRDHSTPIPGRDNSYGFEQGRVGISYQWTFQKSTYLKFPKLNYGTFLMPTVDGSDRPARARNNFEVGFAVPANRSAAQKREAFKFLHWLYGDEQFYMSLSETMGTIPARKSLWTRPEIRDDVVSGNVAKQAPYTVFPGEFPSWMTDGTLLDMASRLMSGKMSPEQAMKQAANEANTKLKVLPAKWVTERRYRPGEGL